MGSDRPRLVEFKRVPAGPLADLKEALRGLYLAAQPATLDDIHDAIERLDEASARNPAATVDSIPSRDAIAAVLREATFPASLQHVLAVAAGLLHRHRRGDELLHATVRGNPDVEHIRRLWEAAAMQRPVGRLIKDITPQDLMVSRALGGTHLPPYVERDHDADLRALVEAAEKGWSNVAILVGDSASGKTRACYEALRRLGEGWRVWPTSGGAATMIAELPTVGPRTVVWLDEAQEYLVVPRDADALTDGLRDLVLDRDRAPVLVLGTLWPENRDALMRRTSTRRLLDGRFIPVLGRFDEQARRAAVDTGDPRLVEAVRSAEDGAVVQYLAGIPDLMDRVVTTSATARALLHAAADARRFDHGEDLPADLLVTAVPGYLDTLEQRRMARTQDWAAMALDSLTWLGRGDTSPLHPSADSAYRLDDYLDQHLRRSRHRIPPPGTFWESCVAHTPVSHLNRLGKLAYQRLLFDYSISLHRRAADAGDTDSLAEWAAILRVRGHVDGLIALSEQRPEPAVLFQLAVSHARRGEATAAKRAVTQAEAAGHRGPHDRAMREIGRIDPAWAAGRWREWAAADTVEPLTMVTKLDELGFVEDAIVECRKLVAEEPRAVHFLLTLYDKQEDTASIRRLLDGLPDPTLVRHHPAVRSLVKPELTPSLPGDDIRTVAARMHAEGDLEALRLHGSRHRDKVVLRHLTELLLERDFEEEARALTESSRGADQAYVDYLVHNTRWHDLGRLIAQGNYRASSAVRAHLNSVAELDPVARRIKRHGLAPDGAIRG